MQILDATQKVVNLVNLGDIAGALAVDRDARVVLIKRRRGDGEYELVPVHYPAGVRVVRKR